MSIEFVVNNCNGKLVSKVLDVKAKYPYCNIAKMSLDLKDYVSVKCEHYIRVRGMCAWKDRESRQEQRRNFYN